MIETEKLSLFNIDIFRQLYNDKYNSLLCDKGFFDYYDNESFMVKFYLRRQVHLFKCEGNYCGYLWHDYPIGKDTKCSLFAFYMNEDYAKYIDISLFNNMNIYKFKFDAVMGGTADLILRNLNCKCDSQTIIMKLTEQHGIYELNNNLIYEKFEHGLHEKLRCNIQNAVFDRIGRIPVTIDDILFEESEEYYLEDYSIFIKSNEDYLGYGQVINSNDRYTLVNIGILPQYRGMGYGSELVKYLINLCKVNKIHDIYIKVDSSNIGAYKLYHKLGFRKQAKYCFYSM